MMRGDNKEVATAVPPANHPMTALRALNRDGEVQYYIVTTWWSRGILLVIGLMIFMILGLLGLIAWNNMKINQLEKQINVEEADTDARQNTNSK